VSEDRARTYFKQFVKNYSEKFYSEYIKWPDGDMLLDIMETYRKLGFPGCFGSIDCTRVQWSLCPEAVKWKATGKEGEPSLVFETVVTHSRFCLHASIAFLGSCNDIQISKNDDFVQRLVSGDMSNVPYLLYDTNGVPKLCKGAYLLSDNGYLKDGIFTCPIKTPNSRNDLIWSEWCESVRKDVECFYRNMKSRWRFLSNGIKYHKVETAEYAFKTGAILHNMLMLYDGLYIECENGNDSFWENLDPDIDCDENDVDTQNSDTLSPFLNKNQVTSIYNLRLNESKFLKGESFSLNSFDDLRTSLITHFFHQFRIGDLWWPKSFITNNKKLSQIAIVDNRVNTHLHKFLYHRESDLRCLDKDGLTYTSKIGHGLFSSVDIDSGSIIGYFSGNIITPIMKLKREIEGKSGYMIKISKSCILDCYDNYVSGKCIISYANSPKNCINPKDPKKNIRANSIITVCTRLKTVAIRSKRLIPAHEEILFSYQSEYKFPQPEN
jgi:hypothetical protein